MTGEGNAAAPVRTRKPRQLALWLVMVFLWLALFALIWQRQTLADWWRLRDYSPPTQIAQLADDTTMNALGRKLFYVYKPRIEPSSEFNQHCKGGGQEFTIVLGCYVSKTGIYLFSIEDERLQGIEQVTAAHEMLHVAYERLSAKERAHIDVLTKQAYAKVTNERIRKNVEQYRAASSAIVPNELHSILGTEEADLPDELEQYYARYFDDRSKIVAYSQRYEDEFTRREQATLDYSRQLSELRTQIDNNTNTLKVRAAALQKEYESIESSRGDLGYAELNRRARAYNASVAAYNQLAEQTKSQIEQYNAVVEKYNAVVLEQRELYRAIDSSPETIDQ